MEIILLKVMADTVGIELMIAAVATVVALNI